MPSEINSVVYDVKVDDGFSDLEAVSGSMVNPEQNWIIIG